MNSSLPYKINWLDLSHVGYPDSIGIGALTGCKHRFIQRNMAEDLGVLKTNNVRHIILLCETVELQRFGVSIESFSDFEVHHYPCEYGLFPNIAELMEIIRRIFHIVETGEKCLIVSRDGLGRSCLVGATIILHTNDTLNYTDVYALMKRSVDRRAVQTVKQYNFLVEFRDLRDDFVANSACHGGAAFDRHLSR